MKKLDCDVYLNNALHAVWIVQQGTFDQVARELEERLELSRDDLLEGDLQFKLYSKENGLSVELGTGYYRSRSWVPCEN
jgi:hypothetical protein